jgi:hypothetical protein
MADKEKNVKHIRPLNPAESSDLRDKFAGLIVSGEMATQSSADGFINTEQGYADAAEKAWKIADAMLAARGDQP